MNEDARTDLAALAASLRGYIEWHEDTGTVGFPRARPTPGVGAGASAAPELAEARSSEAGPMAPVAPAIGADSASAPSALTPASGSGAVESIATAPPTDRRIRLPQLASEVATCRRCALAASRTQTVFARGNPDAAVCFVGEGPGADEDAQGLPFVGRAGQLLDRMITAMGLSPAQEVYICNIVKCRPPGNRRPEPEEVAACMPYLHEQLALVQPRVIVALGNTAVAALLDTRVGITKLRGEWKLYRGRTLVMPTYHPSYLLRPSPQQIEAKRQAWQDLQLVMKELHLDPAKKRGPP
ncbi:MAG TPA: uracil-DNA glycosylase [Polyangiaceae bacterium]|nr:uracil-DNA glycosylase [Polyangiaceae bacterium]